MSATTVSLDLAFRDTEHLRSEYHSFANLINVVHAELQLLERMSGPNAGLKPSIRLCEAATWAFKDREAAAEHGPALTQWRSRIQADLARVQVSPAYEEDGEEARAIIRQVIGDADLRIQELLARHGIAREGRHLDQSAIQALILSGAEETLQSAAIANPPNTPINQRIRVETEAGLPLPHGLPESLGRLGAVLLEVDGLKAVEVSVGGDPAAKNGSALVAVHTGKLGCDLVPQTPPSSIDLSDPQESVKGFIALISYIAGPDSEVVVDPAGTPLLLIQSRNGQSTRHLSTD